MWFFLQTALTLFNTFKLTLLLCAQFPPFAMTLCNEISFYRSINLSVYRLICFYFASFCLASICFVSNVLKIEIFMLITMKSGDLISRCIVLSKQNPARSRQLARTSLFYSPAQPSALSQFHPVPSTLLLNILRPLCGVRSRGLVEYPTTVLSECWVPELMRL